MKVGRMPPPPLFFLKVPCAVHWGWKLNAVPFSKSRPPLVVPPPSSLIGALAYPLGRLLRFPETRGNLSWAESLRRGLVYVGLRVDAPLVPYFDLNRIHFFYRGEERSDAVAVGKTYVLSVSPLLPTITLCYVADLGRVEEALGCVDARSVLVEAAWGITRVGSRESLVSPIEVVCGEARVAGVVKGETAFSFMKKAAAAVDGVFITEEVVDWEVTEIGDYGRARRGILVVPYDEEEKRSKPVAVTVSSGYSFVDVGRELVVARVGVEL